jgi:VanZ family protein
MQKTTHISDANPVRPLYAVLSITVALALFIGLSQSESRSIYHAFDKWLHASVFFLLWWLARISLRWHTLAISLAVVALGGFEELRQAFTPGRTADWADMAANAAGVLLAATLYSAVRGLWEARQELAKPGEAATHAVDWRFDIRLWHWHWYVVLLAGTSRRGLTRQQRVITGRVLGAALLLFATLAAAVGLAVLLLIKVSLGH